MNAQADARQAAVVQMLLHHRQPALNALAAGKQPPSPAADAKRAARVARYEARKAAEHAVWKARCQEQLLLQRAALRALPPQLRQMASRPDLTPSPPNRKFFFLTPPKVYLEPEPDEVGLGLSSVPGAVAASTAASTAPKGGQRQ